MPFGLAEKPTLWMPEMLKYVLTLALALAFGLPDTPPGP